MGIFLGIDGGGSKTSCLIGNEHSVLGTGTAGGSNVIRVGETRAREALASAIQQACANAKVDPSQIERTYVGMAGAVRPAVGDCVRRMIAEIVSGKIEVAGDMVIALQAAFNDGSGVIVIAGTGSIAYGRNAQGKSARAGGWGFAVSDEGSGHWIGRSAISAALRSQDEGESAQLLESIMKFWRLETTDQLVLTANAMPSPDFAALFPVVLLAAKSGDALASAILERAGNELAALARTVISRILSETESVPVAMSGGVFGNSALVRQVFYNNVCAARSNAVVNETVIEPVRGALELARRGTH